MAWFSVPASAYALVSRQPSQFRSGSHATRTFCPACGTRLTLADDANPGEIDVTTCSLDDPARLAPQQHIYTHSQMPWLKLADGLPRYPRSRSES